MSPTTSKPQPWTQIRTSKKSTQTSLIPKSWTLPPLYHPSKKDIDLRPLLQNWDILTPRELLITSTKHDATSLATSLAKGEYTAEEVAIAFCKRAAVGHQLCNNLTEILFEDAIEDARALDREFKRTGKTRGPLHGLPMTFKDCFHIKGYDACNGYISHASTPSTTTTFAIQVVKAAGAVIIAKTNTPQTMLAAECENNVWGRTKNPVVSHLTCGGSSGGEGSNMALRGAAIGIGTDVGGSIRIPAAANGVYGFKPTCGVLPFIGYAPSSWTGVMTGISATLGPLANSARDLQLLTRVMRDAKPWLVDSSVLPSLPPAVIRKPVVGVIHKSGVTPHPPIRRGIQTAVEKLTSAGFKVKEFTPPDFADINEITRALFTVDGLSYQKRELAKAGEPVAACVQKIGFWSMPSKTHEEMWEWNTKRLAICKEMLDLWVEAGIDIVLCPAGPHTAVKPNDWTNDSYTVVWNAVDYPAVVIPFGTADPELDPKDREFEPLSEADAKCQALYDPELMAGAPIALQFVGQKYGDEQLLADVQLIDKVLNSK